MSSKYFNDKNKAIPCNSGGRYGNLNPFASTIIAVSVGTSTPVLYPTNRFLYRHKQRRKLAYYTQLKPESCTWSVEQFRCLVRTSFSTLKRGFSCFERGDPLYSFLTLTQLWLARPGYGKYVKDVFFLWQRCARCTSPDDEFPPPC